MEVYIKKFLRNLIEHKNNLNEYIDQLNKDVSRREEINGLFGELEKEGILTLWKADNLIYNAKFTVKGQNIMPSELKFSNKEELLILIESIDSVEKLFHKPEDDWESYEIVYDVPQYQEWLQQVILYLQDIYDNVHDTFVFETIQSCKKHMNGVDDRLIFNEIVGKLRGIEKNIEKYYKIPEEEREKVMLKTVKKTPMIFISHSSKDEKHVELIVDLFKDMGISHDQVFCSSIPGYGIKTGKDIIDSLYELFDEHDLFVIFVLSHNYFESPMSLNEMGAAWVLKSSYCPFLLPGFEYSDMKGAVDSGKISIKIDSDRRTVQNYLNELYNDLAKFLSINRNNTIIWERARDSFIDKMNSVQVYSDKSISKEAENMLIEAEKDERGLIIKATDFQGLTIQAGVTVMNKPGVRRDEAKMEEALKELIIKGFITQTTDNIFQITHSGYNYIDENIKNI